MILIADRIVVGDGRTVLKNCGVYVDKIGKIAAVDSREALLAAYPHEQVLRYDDSTILPGLMDLHGHLGHYTPTPREWENEYMMAYISLHHARNAFRRGVTTMRDVGSADISTQTLIQAAQMGYFEIPRIITCGRGLCTTGGHGTRQGVGEGVQQVDGPWEMRKAVRARIQSGVHWIKIMNSHRSDMSEFTQAELDAAADEAHRWGRRITAHAGTPKSIQACIDAGFDCIEHATFLSAEQARRMAEKGIAWVPTILPYAKLYELVSDAPNSVDRQAANYYSGAVRAYRENFLALANTGILFGTGTDFINGKETDCFVALEMEYMVRCGLPPLRAIQAATANGAKILQLEEITGQIKPGLEADVLVVQGDPTQDITCMQKVRQLFKGGRVVYTEGD